MEYFLAYSYKKKVLLANLKRAGIAPGGRFELPSYESNRSRIYRLTGLGYPDSVLEALM